MSLLHLHTYYNIDNELQKTVSGDPNFQSLTYFKWSQTCHAIYRRPLVYSTGQTEKKICNFIIICEINKNHSFYATRIMKHFLLDSRCLEILLY